ncbi:arylesterase [Hymenobacter taeanensis]|uniref:Arylesterase n=1 Tax=Hymenobacter taeanensis TaxID=2735321 RepID=A0A6M6BFV5_9BACT|nr:MULTISPECIES: arylesterase [Hymenobacter]QJX46614.1 arylesterase [Hymenobacter taeanensis]UOQ80475.1 arylesterase [Hymenobacter sp. 5414T-23]
MRTVLSLLSGALLCALVSCNSDSQTTTQTTAAATTAAQPPKATSKAAPQTILFFGNSITAGYGVEPEEAFPALIGQKLDSAGLAYTIVNAGLSGETTAGGRNRVGWVLRQPVSVFVLELGGNDGLRGLPLPDTRRNLQAIIDTVRRRSPQAQIVLAGMQIPPNMGPDYATQFKKLYAELAQKNQVKLIPFLLEGVGGVRKLNQRDGIHPTPAGHRLVARNVWAVLQPILQQPATVAP